MSEGHILGISGSLRKGSLNTALLRAAQGWAPTSTGLEIHIYDALGQVPPFDSDLKAPAPPPEVTQLREAITRARGLLVSSPEYNYGIPGVLKNALDWASIPAPSSQQASLAGKPVALMGASPSPFGTVRAQLALRQLFLWTDSRVVAKPEVHVFDAFSRFNEDGDVTDEMTKTFVLELLASLRREIETASSQSDRAVEQPDRDRGSA